MSSKSKRQQVRERHRRQRRISNLVWIGLGALAAAVIGFFVWQGARPRAGESIPVMADTSHIPVDTDPGTYNSDPPTSGPHYADELNAGFYEANDYQYPAGYLVHNLEHGYIIFWYNCDLLDEAGCEDLKTQIQSVLNEFNGFKVIAFPWKSIDVPVVMTSWGRRMEMESFDAAQARAFYKTNLNKAPEPAAP